MVGSVSSSVIVSESAARHVKSVVGLSGVQLCAEMIAKVTHLSPLTVRCL